MPRLPRLVRSVLVSVAALTLLSGCSLVNPHVKWDPPDKDREPSAITLDYAIKYADNAKAAYKEALGNQSKLTSLMGLGLIPLGAAALGLGMTGGGTAAITALGLAGAAGYASGTWLQSKPAQKAYIAGYNATSCAVDAVIPMLYVEKDKPKITAAVDALSGAIGDVENKAAAVRFQIAEAKRTLADPATTKGRATLDALIPAAERQVAEAEKLLASAYDTRAKAVRMLQEAAGAGMSLKEAVDRISGQVSGVLVETGPDIQALASIIGGLAQSYGQFVKIPEGLRPVARETGAQAATERSPAEINLAAALDSLLVSASALQVAIHDVADIVNAVTTGKPIETLKACGVNPDQIVTPLTVDPPGTIILQSQRPSTDGRVVRGGAAPYSVSQQGDSVEGLGVRQTEPFGPAFVVQSTAKTPVGQYTIYISDKGGQRLFVPVEVKPVTSSGTDRPPARPDDSLNTPSGRAAAALNKDPDTFEVTDRAFGRVGRADATSDGLDLDIIITPRPGQTLTDPQIAAIPDSTIIDAVKQLKALKDIKFDSLGIPDSKIRIREKKRGS